MIVHQTNLFATSVLIFPLLLSISSQVITHVKPLITISPVPSSSTTIPGINSTHSSYQRQTSSTSSINQSPPPSSSPTPKAPVKQSTSSPFSVPERPSTATIRNTNNPNTALPDSIEIQASKSTRSPSLSNVTLIKPVNQPTTTTTPSPSSETSHRNSNHQPLTIQNQVENPNRERNPFNYNLYQLIVISCAGLIMAIVLTVASVYCCIKVYHERYPVRIKFGRKFSTFENPIYSQKQFSSYEIDNPMNIQPDPSINNSEALDPKQLY